MKANIYPGRLEKPDWNNIDCISRNRMPPHAYLVQFPDLGSCQHAAAGNQRHVSPYVYLLNGQWSTITYPSINRLPENILSMRSGFHSCSLPSSWQMASQDRLIDTSRSYPFPVTPPRVPDDVPVGVFRRNIRLPLVLGGLRKRIVFQGVHSAFHLFVNGKLAGYSEGSHLPTEFDITAQIHDGDNELFVLVYGYCATSYLNAGGSPFPNGIFRDVYIEAIPAVSVYDLKVRTSRLDEEGFWRLALEIQLVSYRISTESPLLSVQLMANGETVFEAESRVSLAGCAGEWSASPVQAAATAVIETDLAGIRSWTAETPVLYQLVLSVHDRQGRELSCVQQAIGFREVTLDGNRLMVNGVPVRLCPVRRQDYRPRKGNALAIEDLVSDIRLMKRSNVNTILTGHEPPDPIFLELCDIYGLYVIAEAEVSLPTDQQGYRLQDDPAFLPICLNRVERQVAATRNHPAIVCWSMAGSGVSGQNHEAMRRRIRVLDPSRPSLIGLPELGLPSEPEIAELAGRPWYDRITLPPDPAELVKSSHTGQSEGHSGISSRCVVWSEGLVDADQRPRLSLKELAQAYQPIRIEAVDPANGAFVVVNQRNFQSTGDLIARFLLLRDGLEVLTGELDTLRIDPGARRFMEIPYGDLQFEDGSEYVLRILIEQAEATLFAPAGFPVGFREYHLTDTSVDLTAMRPAMASTRLRMERDRHQTIVSGHRFYLVFNHLSGTFDACRFGEKELFCSPVALSSVVGTDLASGPRIHLFETAGTDWVNNPDNRIRPPETERLRYLVDSVETACDGQTAVIEAVTTLAADGCRVFGQVITRYEILTNGTIRIFVHFIRRNAGQPAPTRLGIRLFLRPEFNRATYFGRGPHPGSRRFSTSQRTGLYRQSVSALLENAGIHQEDDARIDVRYLKLQDEQGFGLLVSGDRLFQFSVRPFAAEDRVRKPCGAPMPLRPFIELVLDDDPGRHRDNQPTDTVSSARPTEPTGGSFSDADRKFAFTLTPIVS